MLFRDREDAGRQLAARLKAYADLEDVFVLGIPRGGVSVAFEIANALNVALDVFLSRKLGVPGQEELAFGAMAAGDGRFLDQNIIRAAGISEKQIARITREVTETLQQRAEIYQGNRSPLQVAGKTIILVDDGVATGASIYAAINALRQMKPGKLVVAVPVAPLATCSWLNTMADEFVCLYSPAQFHAVGQFYEQFTQLADEEVVDALKRAENHVARLAAKDQGRADESSLPHAGAQTRAGEALEVSIHLGKATLDGTLTVPHGAKSLVLFAHGSGSNRNSPRNRYVAEVFHSLGIATALFDLLTREEELVDQETALLRFDIALLSKRLIGTTQWAKQYPATCSLSIGYFGASTGSAAALVAATQLPGLVNAVVSRGGRPDLVGEALGKVRAATLLIVGGRDEVIIALNRQALGNLACRHKQLIVVPSATHLFEESGTLIQVAKLAADWFARYLTMRGTNENPESLEHADFDNGDAKLGREN